MQSYNKFSGRSYRERNNNDGEYGKWTYIDGWSEAVIEYIRTLEGTSWVRFLPSVYRPSTFNPINSDRLKERAILKLSGLRKMSGLERT